MRFTRVAPKRSPGRLVGTRAIQRLVVGVNRDTGSQREGDGVTGSAIDHNLFAISFKIEGGVVDIVLKVADNDSSQARVNGRQEGKRKIVDQRAKRFELLQGNNDALGLKRSDEECQFALVLFAAKKYGGLACLAGRQVAPWSGGYAKHLHFVQVFGLFGSRGSPGNEKQTGQKGGEYNRQPSC